MDYVIISTLAYILIVGLLYAPKCPKYESIGDAPIEYFPEIKEEEVPPEPKIIQPELKTATESLMLSLMPIRKLYSLAKKEGIKNYKSMKKADLAIALAGVNPACSV
jgi:hypothetical protein